MGVPHSSLGGTPSQGVGTPPGVPPHPDQARGRGYPVYLPRKDMGLVEVLWDGDGVCPWVWTNKRTETITFPHPSDAGGYNREMFVDISVLFMQ